MKPVLLALGGVAAIAAASVLSRRGSSNMRLVPAAWDALLDVPSPVRAAGWRGSHVFLDGSVVDVVAPVAMSYVYGYQYGDNFLVVISAPHGARLRPAYSAALYTQGEDSRWRYDQGVDLDVHASKEIASGRPGLPPLTHLEIADRLLDKVD